MSRVKHHHTASVVAGGLLLLGLCLLTSCSDVFDYAESVRLRRVHAYAARAHESYQRYDFKKAIAGAKAIIVLDRCLAFGATGNPVAQEIKAMLFNEDQRPKLLEYVVGLGGRDVTMNDFQNMYDQAKQVVAGTAEVPPPTVLQVRA